MTALVTSSDVSNDAVSMRCSTSQPSNVETTNWRALRALTGSAESQVVHTTVTAFSDWVMPAQVPGCHSPQTLAAITTIFIATIQASSLTTSPGNLSSRRPR